MSDEEGDNKSGILQDDEYEDSHDTDMETHRESLVSPTGNLINDSNDAVDVNDHRNDQVFTGDDGTDRDEDEEDVHEVESGESNQDLTHGQNVKIVKVRQLSRHKATQRTDDGLVAYLFVLVRCWHGGESLFGHWQCDRRVSRTCVLAWRCDVESIAIECHNRLPIDNPNRV